MLVFLNGHFLPEAQAVVPVNDRGFLLGDGLFETIRVVNGRPFRMAQHLERMTRGADFLKIKPPFAPKELEKFAAQLIEQNKMPDAILRVTLTRGPGERGYSPKNAGTPTLVMTLHAAPSLENPVEWNLVTSSFHIPAADPLSSFKTTSKILHVMARAEAAEKMRTRRCLSTPTAKWRKLRAAICSGFMRITFARCRRVAACCRESRARWCLEICQSLGLQVNKRVIKPEALRNSEGIFVTQSALGIIPGFVSTASRSRRRRSWIKSRRLTTKCWQKSSAKFDSLRSLRSFEVRLK